MTRDSPSYSLTADVLVAGAAVDLGATVMTKNVEDFRTLGVPAGSY